MANYIAAEFKPLYTPFDYSFPPCKEYIPPVPSIPELDRQALFKCPETAEDAENLLDDLRDRATELFE